MMQISSKQYATALLEELGGRDAKQTKAAVENFVRVLAANNDLGLAGDIIGQFSRLWDAKESLLEADVISARKLDKETLEIVEKYLKKAEGVKKVSLSEKIEAGALGGLIIRYGDKVLDLSLKNKLNELKKQIVSQ